jgi:hypothetical protein
MAKRKRTIGQTTKQNITQKTKDRARRTSLVEQELLTLHEHTNLISRTGTTYPPGAHEPH